MAGKTKSDKPKRDYYQEVTDEILAMMEGGELFWQKDWDPTAGAILSGAMNGQTKRVYTKENAIRLAIIANKHADADGKVDPRFFTFAQAKKLGYSVLPGHHGTWVKQGFYATKDPVTKELLPAEDRHWTSTYTTVFHASDLAQKYEYVLDEEGNNIMEPATDSYGHPLSTMRKKVKVIESIPAYEPDPKKIYTHEEQMELAESILQNSGANIIHDQQDRNFYTPSKDEIHLCKKEAFPELAGYYATALHELGHWTGAKGRLERPGITNHNGFGTPEYAAEELRAELASVFLSIDTGIPLNKQNNAAYLQSWIKTLKNDKMEFFKAVNDAQKIKTYVENLVHEKLKTTTKETQPETEADDQAPILALPAPKPKKLFKYYLKRPAEPGSVPKGAELVDAEDKGGLCGAIYYSRPLNKDEMKEFELKLDKFYESEQFHRIAIFQTDEPWKFQELSKALLEAKENNTPIDFKKYHLKYIDDVPAFEDGQAVSIEHLLDNTYLKFNAPDRPASMSMRSVSMGDILRVDDNNYWVDSIGFTPLQIMPVKDMQIVKPALTTDMEKVISEQKSAVGEEKFEDYQKRFHKAFYDGAKRHKEDYVPTTIDQYEQYLYNHAIEHGLSSIRPCDQKAWEKADTAFLTKVAEESRQDARQMQNATVTVQQNSPYAAISDNHNYAMNLMHNVMKSEPYLKMKEEIKAQESEDLAVASKEASR